MAGKILVVNMGGSATKRVRLRHYDEATSEGFTILDGGWSTLVSDPSPISAGDAREYADLKPGLWDVTLVDERMDVHGPVHVEVRDGERADARVA